MLCNNLITFPDMCQPLIYYANRIYYILAPGENKLKNKHVTSLGAIMTLYLFKLKIEPAECNECDCVRVLTTVIVMFCCRLDPAALQPTPSPPGC